MSSIWDGLVDTVEGVLGGAQGSIQFRDGSVTGGIAFGERRVFSWAALLAAVVVGWLIGRAS